MPMNASHTEFWQTLADLTGKIALELVFAEPGKDNGLLPVNCLLGQIEDLCATQPSCSELQSAVLQARQWLDQVFNSLGFFDAETLQCLHSWCPWMESTCTAGSRQNPLPPLPDSWSTQAGAKNATAVAQSPAPTLSPDNSTEEIPLTMNLEQDAELLREFINESCEHLQNIELGILILEEHPADADTLNSIFRAFHTFKGGSGLLNLTPVKLLAHELESLLDQARQHKLVIDSSMINLILEGGDILKQFMAEIELQLAGRNPPSPILVPTRKLIEKVQTVLHSKPQTTTSPSAPTPLNPSSAPSAVKAQLQEALETPAPTSLPKPQIDAPANENSPSAKGVSSGMVKVATPKLDALVDLVGEMVIAQSLISQDSGVQHLQNGQLTRNLAQLRRITSELQRTAMSLRMVPIKSTFQKMTRLVRDLAGRQGKQVELVFRGEETEIDRNIVEEISDPLIHMVRNSVDHGIEQPEVRAAANKPPCGTLNLKAYHQGGHIIIEIEDDGAGLNKDRIRAKGIEKGMIQPDEDLSDSEIFNLIFAPGFSTAEKITEVSGRGVGMDVVRRNIERLRGKIEIASRPGKGSCFTIYLPLTLAIIDALIVGVGDHRYILPTLSVRESFRATPDMISTVHGRGEMVNVRGRLSPLLRLYEYFDITPQTTDVTQGIVVVVGTETSKRCLLVDQLLGKQEVVIKNLGETFKSSRGLAGAAILGDGRVGLILDTDSLSRLKSVHLAQAA